jgi:hypothetical protein
MYRRSWLFLLAAAVAVTSVVPAWVIYGGSSGLRVDNAKSFHGNPEKNDHYAFSVAAGDVTGDGRDDLALIVEGENVSGTTAEGCVDVYKGSSSGITTTGASSVCVQSLNVGGHMKSVAIGRFHVGSNADVVVYVEHLKNAPTSSGVLAVFRGTSAGISSGNVTYVTQNSPSVSETSEQDDGFGSALAVGDINGDGSDDLAAGVPGEDIRAGAVHVFLGGSAGPLSALDLFLTENHPMVNGGAQSTETFGREVRILDVTNDGRPELIVTAPYEDLSYNSGTMFVLGLQASSGSVGVVGSTTLSRTSLGGISGFGLAFPIAGGVVPAEEIPNAT